MRRRAILAAVLAAWALQGGTGAKAEPALDNVVILSTRFTGDVRSAQAMTNLVRLQVSATFQQADTDTRGRMTWSDDPITSNTDEEAVKRGLQLTSGPAHFVLWGSAYKLQDGIAVQAYVSVTDLFWNRDSRTGIWFIPVPLPDKPDQMLALGLPRTMFRLPEVIYKPDSSDPYPSLAGLTIYKDAKFTVQIGQTGTDYRAFQYTDRGVSLLSNGVRGWARLDYLSRENNIAVRFTGALLRLTRGDYVGAEALLQVADEENTDFETGVNIALMRGLCAELRGEDGMPFFDKAADLAPLDAAVVRYQLAGLAERVGRQGTESASWPRLVALVDEKQPLFSADSDWLKALEEFVAAKASLP